jgi:hypothetical protein
MVMLSNDEIDDEDLDHRRRGDCIKYADAAALPVATVRRCTERRMR